MNWILGFVGAFFGGLFMAGSEVVAGVIIGFFVMFAIGSISELRGRLANAEAEVAKLRKFAIWATENAKATPAPAEAPRSETPAPAPVATPQVAPTPPPVAPAPIAATPSPTPTPAPPPTQPAAPTTATPTPAPAPQPAPAAPQPVAARSTPETAWAAAAQASTPRSARAPAEPDVIEKMALAVKRWFTEGNVPVKIGVIVLFFGVAAALKYAVDQGYVVFPIELRLAGIALTAIAGLAWGWRERVRRPAFGLSVQGGAIGILLLTVFSAYRLYHLLPPGLAFALVVLLVAGSAVLAILQNNMALAVLGFLGGYLAPVLISTGSGNHVALFSYYAVLNAAVFAVSWKRAWRLLNLVGFGFTFGVGTAWGLEYYRPEMFATVEPFLILFFVFYVVIGLLYVLKQTTHRKPWVDGTLVFGTPLLAFPLQAGLLKDDRLALAFSALAVAGLYLGLLWWLRTRQKERLLTEAYGALAIGFATLAVPLAFSASTTAGVWALQGAGLAWLGLRQNRTFPWLSGLALQGLAAVAYVIGLNDYEPVATETVLLLNRQWLGAAILGFAAFALSLLHERHRKVLGLHVVLFAVGGFWWLVAGLTQMDRAHATIGAWVFAILYLGVGAAGFAVLRASLAWDRLNWMVGAIALMGLAMVPYAQSEFGTPFTATSMPGWTVYGLALGYALWQARASTQRSIATAHLAALWSLGIAVTLQASHLASVHNLAQGWRFLAEVAPAALLTTALWRYPAIAAWPRAQAFPRYALGWFLPALLVLAVVWVGGLFAEGDASPLPYLPLLNPLELTLLGVAGLLAGFVRDRMPDAAPVLRGWPLLAFAFLTIATLRAVHHLHGEPWGPAVLDSGFSQAALTIVWSMVGVGAWIYGSRRLSREVWTSGAALMGVVLAKLLLVDRHYTGDLNGIVSFLAVGALLVGVGWIAPSPPRARTPTPAAAPVPPEATP